MLWGCIVSKGKPYTFTKDSEYEFLHISNATLSKSNEQGKTYLLITKKKEIFILAVLQKDKVESYGLNIYVRSNEGITLTVSGQGEINVTGYFEPSAEFEEEDEGDFLEEDLNVKEMESESEEGDEEIKNEQPRNPLIPV